MAKEVKKVVKATKGVRKCKKCGSELPADNKICYNCGTKK